MRILHYSLGFPPYRSGGMTKFCMDLMKQQSANGHQVALLWPGQMRFIFKKIFVEDKGFIEENGIISNIRNFELINPLPIPYDEGIKNPSEYMRDGGYEVYERLLDSYRPDIIHIHTLMGIHKTFFLLAKRESIKLVFTAHDFFPICPKVTLFRHGEVCKSMKSCLECGICNTTALNINTIKCLQSSFYRNIKNLHIIKKIRKKHRDKYLGKNKIKEQSRAIGKVEDYQMLRSYYRLLLSFVDTIHYNSSITKNVYESVFGIRNSHVIGITHANISNNKKLKFFSDKRLYIRYLGPQGEGKGYFLLKESLDKLWCEKKNFCLDIHFVPVDMSPYIKVHNRYTYNDLEKIFDETDVLVVPSIWYETFGYTVLEALSYGVPVIISGTVGAKDILAHDAGVIIEDINVDNLCDIIRKLDAKRLGIMNKTILESQSIMQLNEMSLEIEEKCYC